MTKRKAHATPTKEFFVRMITKDIALEDCILDLIDNSIDGARKVKNAAHAGVTVEDYTGFYANVIFDSDGFQIVDNCGGIEIAEAIDYAFHFGRRSDAPAESEYSIGLYGIGMKRAIFKMGNVINIESSTLTEAFRTTIDVAAWLTRTRVLAEGEGPVDDWDFDIEDAEVNTATGTRIAITELHSAIAAQYANPEFVNALARIVGRDYAKIIAKGFAISINGRNISGFQFTVGESAEFRPVRVEYSDQSGVDVAIIAGMTGPPPDDLQPAERRTETDNFGWFVLCNDRVVVAADKSNQTVWGDENFPAWHYQYNGFIGVVAFNAKDPNLLPWRTTKRDVDGSSPIYRRAIEKMKDATRPWIKYTHDRKVDIPTAKLREAMTMARPLFGTAVNPTFQVPQVSTTSSHIATSSIQYSKPTAEIAKVKKLLGNTRMPNYQVGLETFDYFLKNEAEE